MNSNDISVHPLDNKYFYFITHSYINNDYETSYLNVCFCDTIYFSLYLDFSVNMTVFIV